MTGTLPLGPLLPQPVITAEYIPAPPPAWTINKPPGRNLLRRASARRSGIPAATSPAPRYHRPPVDCRLRLQLHAEARFAPARLAEDAHMLGRDDQQRIGAAVVFRMVHGAQRQRQAAREGLGMRAIPGRRWGARRHRQRASRLIRRLRSRAPPPAIPSTNRARVRQSRNRACPAGPASRGQRRRAARRRHCESPVAAPGQWWNWRGCPVPERCGWRSCRSAR